MRKLLARGTTNPLTTKTHLMLNSSHASQTTLIVTPLTLLELRARVRIDLEGGQWKPGGVSWMSGLSDQGRRGSDGVAFEQGVDALCAEPWFVASEEAFQVRCLVWAERGSSDMFGVCSGRA
jgi:hypothetical protein